MQDVFDRDMRDEISDMYVEKTWCELPEEMKARMTELIKKNLTTCKLQIQFKNKFGVKMTYNSAGTTR